MMTIKEKLKYIKENFNGFVMIHRGENNDEWKPLFKWYRFSFLVTRRLLEDYGEGKINAGFPRRFKAGWHDYVFDTWTWYIVPFHIIVPALKFSREWFYWKIVIKMDEKRREINPTIEIIEKGRKEIFNEGFECASKYYNNHIKYEIRQNEIQYNIGYKNGFYHAVDYCLKNSIGLITKGNKN